MSVVEPIRDEKAGWSSMCRRGEVRMCVTAGAACTNPKHGRKEARRPTRQQPEQEETPMREQSDGLVWEEPPTTRGGGKPSVTAEQVEAMRSHPKRWLRVKDFTGKTSANTAMQRLKKGVGGIEDTAGWEFRACKIEDGSALYARFVGTEAA